MPLTQDPIETFSLLPDDVQRWLNSHECWYKMIAFNDRLNLQGSRRTILPDLVFRLVTGNVQPQDFVSTLALSLKVGDTAARSIARELEKDILHPIEGSLRVGPGIEVQMLHFSGDTTIPPIAAVGDSGKWKVESGKTGEIITQENIKTLNQESKIASVAERPRNDSPAVPTGPVILHTEEEEAKPMEQTARPMFSVKIPVNKKQYVSAPAPLAARVEIPADRGQVTGDRLQGTGSSGNLEPRTSNLEPLPPMRALSDLHSEQVTWDREQVRAQTSNIEPRTLNIVSVAPKSAATPLPPMSQIPQAPKIIPVVAKIPLRRVVHYSDWRTLI